MNKTGEYIKGKNKLLSIYFTAEYPVKGCTKEIILSLQKEGVDLIEVGIPFSDPIADGPVIQKSSEIALANGFNLNQLFIDLEEIQSKLHIPIVLMGYFNTMLAFGIELFLKQCNKLGIDTLILPDFPPEVYEKSYLTLFQNYHVSPVFLVTPQSSETRISYLNTLSNAFIYIVSDNSITGSVQGFSENQLNYFERINKRNFDVPVLIGFGISDKASYLKASEYSNGVIIGTAFIKSLTKSEKLNDSIQNFIKTFKISEV